MNILRTKHRLFIASPLTEDATSEIKKNIAGMPGKKVPKEKWHFTLEFLGDVEPERTQDLIKLFQDIPLPPAFQITFNALGAFPNSHSARVLWVGIKEGEKEFSSLSKIFRDYLIQVHFRVDERPFVPHVTISRFYHSENISKWISEQPFHKVHMSIEKLVLYESILEPNQSRYSILSTRILPNSHI